jgi:hypothetical protein
MSVSSVRKWFWNPYSRLGARLHGWLDARLDPPMPRWEAPEPTPYLRQLHEATDLEIGDLMHGLVRQDTPLDDKLQQLVATERGLQQETDVAEHAKAEATQRFSSVNPSVPAATAEHRVKAYWFMIIFLFVCEIPLNGTVFQVLKEGQMFNYLMAAVIGLPILWAAHAAGIHLRRKAFDDRTSSVMFVVAMSVPLVTMTVIASLRQYYLHVRQLVNPDGEKVAYLTFLSISLLMFTVAFYISWFSHLVGAEELTSTRRVVERLAREMKKTQKALRVVRAARMNLHRKYVTQARQALDGFWQLVHVYGDANLHKRGDRTNRDNDCVLTDPARKALHVNMPRALQSAYLDYRDAGSAEVRSVGSNVAASTPDANTADLDEFVETGTEELSSAAAGN